MIEHYTRRGGMEYFTKENWIHAIAFTWINFNFAERHFALSLGNGSKQRDFYQRAVGYSGLLLVP